MSTEHTRLLSAIEAVMSQKQSERIAPDDPAVPILCQHIMDDWGQLLISSGVEELAQIGACEMEAQIATQPDRPLDEMHGMVVDSHAAAIVLGIRIGVEAMQQMQDVKDALAGMEKQMESVT